jgi:hypothetical protein
MGIKVSAPAVAASSGGPRTLSLDANHSYAWRFQQAAGIVVLPNEGNGAACNIVANGPKFPELGEVGPFGNCAGVFQGEYLKLDAALTDWPTTNYTWEMAMVVGDTSAGHAYFHSPGAFQVYKLAGGTQVIATHTAAVSTALPSGVMGGAPQHIMVTHTSADATLRMYVDGGLIASAACAGVRAAPTKNAILFTSDGSAGAARSSKVLFLAMSNVARPQSYARAFFKNMRGW